MKKLLVSVLLLAALLTGGVVVNKKLTPKTTEGTKTIKVSFAAEGEIFFEDEVTGEEFLLVSDVLYKIEENGQLSFMFDGEKDSEWGRFILGVEDYITEDMSTGPWWLYNSPNSESCAEAGFCSGIDMQAVEDGDIFEFVFE